MNRSRLSLRATAPLLRCRFPSFGVGYPSRLPNCAAGSVISLPHTCIILYWTTFVGQSPSKPSRSGHSIGEAFLHYRLEPRTSVLSASSSSHVNPYTIESSSPSIVLPRRESRTGDIDSADRAHTSSVLRSSATPLRPLSTNFSPAILRSSASSSSSASHVLQPS